MNSRSVVIGLLASSALAGFATAAWADEQPVVGGQGLLDEVVVTATRRNDTVSKVPLSITAVTPKDIDQQGLKAIDDLARIAPALTIRRGLDNQITIAVRGIIASAGAQTTGVYLDDVPMAKRIVIGASTGNGNPSPPLFDLERVEVLRGPQGTLYGGSSEGGTIRFITPTPSLTTYSTYGRAEASTTEGGSGSYEAGVAAGGPPPLIVRFQRGAAEAPLKFDHVRGGCDFGSNSLAAQPGSDALRGGERCRPDADAPLQRFGVVECPEAQDEPCLALAGVR